MCGLLVSMRLSWRILVARPSRIVRRLLSGSRGIYCTGACARMCTRGISMIVPLLRFMCAGGSGGGMSGCRC